MEKKNQVKRIFDSISQRYDFLNHFLSGGVDYYWRKKALKLSKINSQTKLLDVACGTGDFAISANKMGVKSITGVDLSLNMLKLFNKKVHACYKFVKDYILTQVKCNLHLYALALIMH